MSTKSSMATDPERFFKPGGELMKMVTQKWLGKVTQGITDAISVSFATDDIKRPVRTNEEIRRRFFICINWFCILRKDMHWSVPRILDALPRALRTELDGGKWSPDDEREKTWVGKGDAETPIELQDEGDPDMAEDVPEVKGHEAEGV